VEHFGADGTEHEALHRVEATGAEHHQVRSGISRRFHDLVRRLADWRGRRRFDPALGEGLSGLGQSCVLPLLLVRIGIAREARISVDRLDAVSDAGSAPVRGRRQ